MAVYVATVFLKYSIVAVAETEANARRLAAGAAINFIGKENLMCPANVRGIDEWYGITVTKLDMNTVTFEGNAL